MAEEYMAQESTADEHGEGRPTLAERADEQVVYAAALQPRPQDDCDFYFAAFERAYNRRPLALREDFAGTFQVSLCWARKYEDCVALAVDFDGPTLDWGKTAYLDPEPDAVRNRVTLLQSDVLKLPKLEHPLFDVIAGNNYSHFTFKTESLMEEYLGIVYKSLNKEGILVLDCYGGPEAHGTSVEEVASYQIPVAGEEREVGFDYVYEQASYDPVTKHQTVKVHFKFEDGSWLREAFTYDWRVWDISELRACMKKVGFAKSEVYIDGYDEGFNYRHNLEPQADWEQDVKDEEFFSAYVVAHKT